MSGNNLAGADKILGSPEHKGKRVADTYAKTPVFEPDTIPRGRCCHIGGGVWLSRCRACDDYMLTYGSILFLREFAEHEADHGLDVVGWNIPILPGARS